MKLLANTKAGYAAADAAYFFLSKHTHTHLYQVNSCELFTRSKLRHIFYVFNDYELLQHPPTKKTLSLLLFPRGLRVSKFVCVCVRVWRHLCGRELETNNKKAIAQQQRIICTPPHHTLYLREKGLNLSSNVLFEDEDGRRCETLLGISFIAKLASSPLHTLLSHYYWSCEKLRFRMNKTSFTAAATWGKKKVR